MISHPPTSLTGIHLMAKPIGPLCNLDCGYCFYLEKESLFPAGKRFRMSDDVLDAYVKGYIAATPASEVEFTWQGGEPTLVGKAFFERAVALQRRHANGKVIRNTLQTNGTLLDDEWGAFLKREGFLVGVSLDGTRALNDVARPDKRGRSSYDDTVRGLQVLLKHGVDFNVLVTVSQTGCLQGRLRQLLDRRFCPCCRHCAVALESRKQVVVNLEPAQYVTSEMPIRQYSSMRDRIGRFSALVPYDDKLALGAWRYSGRLPDLSDTNPEGNPQLRRGSSGAYAIGERLLAGGKESSGKRLAAFAQAGIADPRTNRFSSYLGAGVVASGWGLAKESDQFGASIARASNGSHYMRMQTTQSLTRAETTVELSYLTKVSKYLTVQPDLQYVIFPNTDPSIANAWVLQLRFEMAF